MNEHADLTENIITRTEKVMDALIARNNSNWLDIDLTKLQLKALFLLNAVDGMPMRRLADRLGTSVTAVTGLVDRLVEHGLVRREEDPEDRRLVIARLTDAGRKRLERLQEVRRDRFGKILAQMNTDELKVIAQAMNLLYSAILAEVEGQER